ncbi:MAG: ABC transporter substrate-binding protein [Alphaproteobacteria bacterium]|nr:ABC transporter substrate-binding protein [Alphaproteobacteria bacterium]
MPSRREVVGGLVLAGGLFLGPRAGAEAAETAAARFVEGLAARAIAVLRSGGNSLEQRELVFRELLREGFDLEFIGRFALGAHWRSASAEQQRDYQELFADYVLKTYSRRFGRYAGESLAVVSTRAAGQHDVIVYTKIDRPGGAPAIQADWRVRDIGSQFRIVDIMVEGVSMAQTQRQEFAAVVQQQGLAGLLQALRARTQRLAATDS